MIGVWRVFYRAWLRFNEDDGWAIASHIALSGLTSLFPFLIFVGTLAGGFGLPSLAASASHLVLETWPPQVAGPIVSEIERVLTQPHTGVATASAALAVYFASSGVEAVRIGLNRAYDARDERPWWLTRLESFAYVVVGAVALIGFTFLVVLEPLVWSKAVKAFPHLVELERLFTIARLATITLVLVIVLLIGHMYLAAGKRGLTAVFPGVVLTCALWLGFGEGFGLYIARFSQNYITTYAGLASVMIAIVFLYVLSAIFIYGGEFNAEVSRARAVRAERRRLREQQKAGAQDVRAGS